MESFNKLTRNSFRSCQLLLKYTLVILCLVKVEVNCRTLQNVSESRLPLERLNEALDNLLFQLYGDIEPRQELFWEPHHSNHIGDENALHYTNEWLVHVNGGKEAADSLAARSGYENLGELKEFPEVYLMRKPDHPAEHKRSSRETTQQLISSPEVHWADQQYSKSRAKRDVDLISLVKNFRLGSFLQPNNGIGPLTVINPVQNLFNDPLWEKQWYMVDTRTKQSLPRLDLNVIPVFQMGYSGKGVNVVILDDGLDHTHPDLSPNYVASISGDLNDNDNDPKPRDGGHPENSHGTRCAGEVAMIANNSICGVGIAYNSGIGGVRMLDGPVSDRIEGEALSFALDGVDVYSASWGPNDDGQTVEGPGRLAQRALIKGVTQGRHGKGVIYIWASGNGGSKDDCCSVDGYASNVFTLSIGSASESGSFPWYGEKCPSTLAVTYSSGAYTDQKIATTDLSGKCTTSHTGTSASAPLAAGIVALTLEANPKLTWRDIQHLVVWTSQPGPLADNPGWRYNGVGFQYNSRFGFGLMDAKGMVTLASNWTTVPPQQICRMKLPPLSVPAIDPTTSKILEFVSDACRGTPNEVRYLEHVQVVTTVQYSRRGSLQIDLTSPKKTSTTLLFPRKYDISPTGFIEWPFTSVHTWGEDPFGKWTLNFTDVTRDSDNQGRIENIELVLFGTLQPSVQMQKAPRVYPNLYKKKREFIENDSSVNSQQVVKRMQAILEDMRNWI